MLKKIAIGLAVLVLAVLGFAATRPDSFHVQRTASIKAPPERLVALLSDFHAWESWSPWEKLDPAMKRTFSGAATGSSAIYEWAGNDKVGKGRMEIQEVTATKVAIKLDFITPMEANNTIAFTLEPKGDSTDVVWAMDGPQPYMTKLMTLFMNMDAMIGKDFEAGLTNLKAVAEKEAAKP